MLKHRSSVVVIGVMAALVISGCGRQTPAGTPLPIAFSANSPNSLNSDLGNPSVPGFEDVLAVEGGEVSPNPELGETGLENLDFPSPDLEASEGAVAMPVASDSVATAVVASETVLTEAEVKRLADEAAAAEAKAKAEEEAKAKAESEAKAKAEEEAKAKAEAEERQAAERLLAMTPQYDRSIGEGGLHSAWGISIAPEKVGDTEVEHLFVVDNARNGLLGKFAAVRKYETATGQYTQKSFEDIGAMGARNLPVSVTRVQVVNSKVLAADDTTTWTFDAGANLLESKPGTFETPVEVNLPNSDHRYRISAGQLQRVAADDAVVLTFGEDRVTAPSSLALDKAGNLYVSGLHKNDQGQEKAAVVVFKAPQI